jgi:hypothetical protein
LLGEKGIEGIALEVIAREFATGECADLRGVFMDVVGIDVLVSLCDFAAKLRLEILR